MTNSGYYRNPTLWKNKLVFVADDDLWMVSLEGGKAERLTSGIGEANDPVFSPDGQWIAFTGTYEGHSEVYVMPAAGGEAQRLTYVSEGSAVVGWKNANEILFSTTKNHPFRLRSLYKIDFKSEKSERLACGPANFISYNPAGKGSVIQRHGHGYVSWKRYKGGTAGELWIDHKGKGEFKKLISIAGNALKPLWVQNRIYFISDHKGHGNVYSCTEEGADLKRHTSHEDFFVRGLSYNGTSFVYAAGGDLFQLSADTYSSEKIQVDFPSSFAQRARKFADSSSYLSRFNLNKTGSHTAIISRGRPFSFANWEGAVHQYGEKDGIRYKFINWLHDNKRLLIVSDRAGADCLEIHDPHSLKEPVIFKKMDLGRIITIRSSPTKDEAVFINHRCELFHVKLSSQKLHLIDKGTFADMNSLNWSPDGKWVVYDYPISERLRAIKLCEIKTFKTHVITRPVLEDFNPRFDPEGKYIYFLSNRTYSPYRDNLQFEMGFPKGTKPYLILLDETLTSPFIPQVKDSEDKPKKDGKKDEGSKQVKIDLKGIENRILEFPVSEGNYTKIAGIPGKVLYLSRPLQSALGDEDDSSSKGNVECYDFATQKEETLISKVSSFTLSADSKWLCYYGAKKLRVIKAGEKPQDNDPSYRKGGWIDLNRIKISVNPLQEWTQIFDEVWRLQKDFFWTEDMSKVDWKGIYNRYRPLVERISTRGELTDLIAEMHGELGTSHAYVFGGDFRQTPYYPLGELGADFTYDKAYKGFKMTNIACGDRWAPSQTSPLTSPGLGIEEGDVLLAINGQKLEEKLTPEKLLVNQAHNTVSLLIKCGKKKEKTVSVRTLLTQTPVRYRDWVEKNRAYVHEKTKGQVGYIHIPDMGAKGFAEFHRGFLSELDRDGLVVDVRFNGGGNVSGLLLEKLSRKRLGYDQSRWWSPMPYPHESPLGPMVALTNEYAGSDGDIFSHSFKMLKLGKLIGKRTWGGVIGMWFRHGLVDGGGTSQPEFSFWFNDVGWGVENYGVDPDIEVEITPQDYEKGIDPQLDRGIAEVLGILKTSPPSKPFLTDRPNLAPPKLEA
ncbi:MAG: PDZ domain-containing protein [Alphaproteobacteria bacterium]|nr:PDZ domain-containing protein [Alphaproteobacteria bacterium]